MRVLVLNCGSSTLKYKVLKSDTGEVMLMDKRAGHIPGARNVPYTDLLQDGRIRPFDEVRGLLSEQDVYYCGSGVTACVSAFAAPWLMMQSRSISPNRRPPSLLRPSTGWRTRFWIGPRDRACILSTTMCFRR